MDIAHNKITQELPFDAVSNNINSSITQYKDGKDQHLVNGTTDIAAKNSVIEAFYNRLKDPLITTDDATKEVYSNGTSLGRFLVNNDNDMVEKSTESLASETGKAIFPVMKLMLRKQVIPVCAMSVQLSKNVKDVAKKSFVKSLPKISVPTSMDSYKDNFVKSIIEQTVGEKIVDISFGSLSEYLRDTINVFSKNRDNTKEFFERYTKRYKYISDISSKLAISVSDMLKEFMKLSDNKDGISSSEANSAINKMTASAYEINAMYNELITKYTDDDDLFTLVNQKYKFDVMSFAVKKANNYQNDYSGITKQSLLEYVKQEDSKTVDSDKEKMVFSTIFSPKGVNKIIEGVQGTYPDSISMELLMNKQKRSLFSVIDEMTVEEFYNQVDLFNKYTKDFRSDVDKILVDLIDSTTRVANITGTLSTYVLDAIEKIGKIQQPSDYNLAMLVISIAAWSCLDLMTVVNAMHYINANDLVMKTYLYENTVNFAKYIDDCIQSWRK